MKNQQTFGKKLSSISRLWEQEDHDKALAEVEALQKEWPGNGHLLMLWASLVQLQEHPKHSLDEAKQALEQAIVLDSSSPAGSIELGHFLDGVR